MLKKTFIYFISISLLRLSCFLISPRSGTSTHCYFWRAHSPRLCQKKEEEEGNNRRKKKTRNKIGVLLVTALWIGAKQQRPGRMKKKKKKKTPKKKNRNETTQIETSRKSSTVFLGLWLCGHYTQSTVYCCVFAAQHHRRKCSQLVSVEFIVDSLSRSQRTEFSLLLAESREKFSFSFFLFLIQWNFARTRRMNAMRQVPLDTKFHVWNPNAKSVRRPRSARQRRQSIELKLRK